jgi:hypothetical protein
MNLTEYLNQESPKHNPMVNLVPEDYIVISQCTRGKFIFIPEIQNRFPECTGEYFVRTGESVCRVIKHNSTTDNRSCFYIN